jgi:hypothetical protein
LPLSTGGFRTWSSKAHLPTSARFRAPHRRVSGQLYETASGGTSHVASLSCRLSATGVRFLGILAGQGNYAPPTIGLPARPVLRRLAPDQVSVFHTREIRLGLAVLSTPGTAVSARPQEHLWPPPAASQRPAPATLCNNPSPRRSLDEASARIHWHSAHTQPSPHL